MPALVEIENLYKDFRGEGGTVKVLENLNLKIQPGEILTVEGASGVGKSTLLHLVGTMDQPTSGAILVDGQEITSMKPSEKERFRSSMLGFIFQHHYLLPDFSVIENVMMPLLILGIPFRRAMDRAEEALSWVGLSHRLHHFPSQISGGEMARAGVARALVGEKKLILADEPTGNLDRQNSEKLVDLLFQLHSKLNFTLLIVTHDLELAKKIPVRYRMGQGTVERFS